MTTKKYEIRIKDGKLAVYCINTNSILLQCNSMKDALQFVNKQLQTIAMQERNNAIVVNAE